MFKFNFDGSMIESKSVLGWIIIDSNGIIKMADYRHLGKTSIIILECMTLRVDTLAATNNDFLSLEIEGDFKIVIDYYNNRINVPCSIKILMEEIWKSQDLNTYNYQLGHQEGNKTTDYLAKKVLIL